MTVAPLKAPFPYFGGKSTVAASVWERFGDVQNYVEPFFGSGAVLLSRPHEPGTETCNDFCCYLTNFWRALQHDPQGVAEWSDNPVSELDLHARHRYLVLGPESDEFRETMRADPDFYDVKFAGWWVWGISCWIGGGWCQYVEKDQHLSEQRPHLGHHGGMGIHKTSLNKTIPYLKSPGCGVNRAQLPEKRPHLSSETGIHRTSLYEKRPQLDGNLGVNSTLLYNKRPDLGAHGMHAQRASNLEEYLHELSARLRRVRICCGDWSRVCGPSPTWKQGMTGVFLDPPYDHTVRSSTIYAQEMPTSDAVREWAIANGDNPLMRIALCGYDTEHAMPDTWEVYAWKAQGGYGMQAKEGRGRANREREVVWFSPHCLKPNRLQTAISFDDTEE